MSDDILALIEKALEAQNQGQQTNTTGLMEETLASLLAVKPSGEEAARAVKWAKSRKDLVASCSSPFGRELEKKKCTFSREGMIRWFQMWAYTCDPRPTAPIFTNCFVPYEFQVNALNWMWDLIFEKHEDGLIAKSRDVGVSWLTCGFAIYCWLFAPKTAPFHCLFASRTEFYVDSRADMSTLFEKMRFMIARLPKWMLPAGFNPRDHLTYMKIINPETGSSIRGESSNDQLGRGGRFTCIFFDEHAAFPSGGYSAWTASSESTRSRIAISTPLGKSNKFAELYHTPGFNKLTLHWTQHPYKTKEWYEEASKRMTSAEIAQELDIDFQGSLAGRLFPMYSENHHVITWSEFAAVIGDEAVDKNPESGAIRYRIPKHWALGVAMDVGTTIQHPNVTTWCATAPEDSELSGSVFLYRQNVIPENAHPGMVGPILNNLMQFDEEKDRLQLMVMSHEANSERLAYNLEHDLRFESWDTKLGYNQGIAQMQDYLALDMTGEHPFRPQFNGRPRLYIIVEDSQGELINVDGVWTVSNAIDDAGFKRLRQEIPLYHIPSSEAGKAAKQQRPFKAMDDAIDTVRALAAQLWPEIKELSQAQKLDKKMPDRFKGKNLKDTFIQNGSGAIHAYIDLQNRLRAELDDDESTEYYPVKPRDYDGSYIRTDY